MGPAQAYEARIEELREPQAAVLPSHQNAVTPRWLGACPRLCLLEGEEGSTKAFLSVTKQITR